MKRRDLWLTGMSAASRFRGFLIRIPVRSPRNQHLDLLEKRNEEEPYTYSSSTANKTNTQTDKMKETSVTRLTCKISDVLWSVNPANRSRAQSRVTDIDCNDGLLLMDR
ncbi:unnamed protein product [Leuciscus chuanchicus]